MTVVLQTEVRADSLPGELNTDDGHLRQTT